MRATIYNQITAALQGIAEIAHVGLWNNQMQYIAEEQPFDTPAVFIEFDPIEWQHLLHGVREAVVTIRLHVITDSRVGTWSDTIAVFNLLDSINAELHGLHHTTSNGSVMDALTLVNSTTDHNFDELQENVETYTCHITDRTAYCR